MADTSHWTPFKGKIISFQLPMPMRVKHSSTGTEYTVNQETASRIRNAFHLYDDESAVHLPLVFKHDGNEVVWAGWDTTGGPQAFTNGH